MTRAQGKSSANVQESRTVSTRTMSAMQEEKTQKTNGRQNTSTRSRKKGEEDENEDDDVNEVENTKKRPRGRPKKKDAEKKQKPPSLPDSDNPFAAEADEDVQIPPITSVIQTLYSNLRKSEERISLLKREELSRQHEIERVRWTTRVEELEDTLTGNESLLNSEKSTLENEVKELNTTIKELETQVEQSRDQHVELQNEFDNYKKLHNSSTLEASSSTLSKAVDAEKTKQKVKLKELEKNHSKIMDAEKKKNQELLKESEAKFELKIQQEVEKAVKKSKKELEKIIILKNGELDILKEMLDKKDRQYIDSVSQGEKQQGQLKEKLESITQELDQEKKASAAAITAMSEDIKSPIKSTKSSATEKQLRSDIAELKKELLKKTSESDKTQIELEKVRNQLQTSKSVMESKMSLLKSKIKTLETQLSKSRSSSGTKSTAATKSRRNQSNGGGFGTPIGLLGATTPVAPGSGPGTRFHRFADGAGRRESNNSGANDSIMNGSAFGGNATSKFSTFSTTPFLSKTGLFASTTTASNIGDGSPRAISTPRMTSPTANRTSTAFTPGNKLILPSPRKGVLQLSPVRNGANVEAKKVTFTAVSKATGKKVSLFDDDDDGDDSLLVGMKATTTQQKQGKKRGQNTESNNNLKNNKNTTSAVTSFSEESSAISTGTTTEEEPKKRRRKRKLNSNVNIDLYDSNGDDDNGGGGRDADHPDLPGSVFKRARMSLHTATGKPLTTSSITDDPMTVNDGTSTHLTADMTPSKSSKRPNNKKLASKSLGKEPSLGLSGSTENNGGGLFGRDISPLKARNRGIRKIFKV